MEFNDLIPTPEAIPAPSWLLITLEQLLFLLHIIVINIVLGGSLILLYNRFGRKADSLEGSLHGPGAKKIPTLIALGINFGVAPLLFLQVVYGHLFYSSSVLMASYWILVIPLLILAYYGAYVHIQKYDSSALLSKSALFFSVIFILYIGFMLVNNNSLMEQPEKWGAYFAERGGSILNLDNSTILPRYLHFVTASVAIGGLFFAVIWNSKNKKGMEGAVAKVNTSLKIFAVATSVQVIIGFWYLLALPSEFIVQFMGQNLFYTIVLFAGIIVAIGAIVTGFLGNLRGTISMIALTLVMMIVTRFNLRTLYLEDNFSVSSLELNPQTGVMILFFLILVIGLGTIAYMLKIAFPNKSGRTV